MLNNNPLRTRSDMQAMVEQLVSPLKQYYSEGKALVHTSLSTEAQYEHRAAAMEAFARPLWGVATLLAGGGESDLWDFYIEGFRNGSNPKHPEYWGKSSDSEQRNVEMAALALTLMLLPDRIISDLGKKDTEMFAEWLYQINDRRLPDNNWLFFRVLVNVALKRAGLRYDAEQLASDLERIDAFYLGDGWYSDGKTEQRDYYVPFAMHYYSLLYAGIMKNEDPERAAKYAERAALFAQDYIAWFAGDGSAIPFGRSLTYRFAQGAFWSACAFAGVEVFSWGVMKGLVLRHLRWWLKQPIFLPDGVLSIGYTYPNEHMSEFYNAFGSPYWALKIFLPLALPADHPFWTAEEEELPPVPAVSVQQQPHMILLRDNKSNHVVALTSGQYANFEPTHTDAKYCKFAYSNLFGFSTPRGSYGLKQGAYDSMLALSEGDGYYRVRRRCEKVEIVGNVIYSVWKPWKDVEIETWLIPAGTEGWHVRVHKLLTARALHTAEGGFSIRREKDLFKKEEQWLMEDASAASAAMPWGISGIVNLSGVRQGKMIYPEPNTNLLHPHTLLPTLSGELEPGEHWLAAAVLGTGLLTDGKSVWNQPPVLRQAGGHLQIWGPQEQELLLQLKVGQ